MCVCVLYLHHFPIPLFPPMLYIFPLHLKFIVFSLYCRYTHIHKSICTYTLLSLFIIDHLYMIIG